MKKFLIILVFCLFVSQFAYAKDFYSDGIIQAGEEWESVSIYDTAPNHTTVTMTGGSVTDVLNANDASTLNMSAGLVRGGLGANDQSTVNISGGSVGNLGATNNATVNFSGNASADARVSLSAIFNVYGGTIYYLTGGDSAVVNVYGGVIDGAGLNASDLSVFNLMGGSVTYLMSGSSATINVFGHELAKTNTGGTYGDGQITGYWQDGSPFAIDLYGTYAYSRINLIPVPEPATLLLFGLGTFLLRKSERRMKNHSV